MTALYAARFSVVIEGAVEADSLAEAEAFVRAGMTQYKECTLLSIIREGAVVTTSGGSDPKGPTPFNRPPSGTPGSPDAKPLPELVDQIAVAA
jgi:hypothetical protein